MANTVTNLLTLRGSRDQLERFQQAAARDGRAISVENFLPIPAQLEDFPSSQQTTAEQAQLNTRYHGEPDRYQWLMRHWGTGSDASGTHLTQREDSLEYFFLTRNSPFSPNVWETVAARFPALTLDMTYDEPLMELTGKLHAEDGAVTHAEYRRYTEEESEAMWGRPATA